jgi:hypothetical protein
MFCKIIQNNGLYRLITIYSAMTFSITKLCLTTLGIKNSSDSEHNAIHSVVFFIAIMSVSITILSLMTLTIISLSDSQHSAIVSVVFFVMLIVVILNVQTIQNSYKSCWVYWLQQSQCRK